MSTLDINSVAFSLLLLVNPFPFPFLLLLLPFHTRISHHHHDHHNEHNGLIMILERGGVGSSFGYTLLIL